MTVSSANSEDGFAEKKRLLGARLRGSALARIVFGIGVVLGSTLATFVVLQQVGLALVGPSPGVATMRLVSIVTPAILAAAVFGSYILYHRVVNRGWPTDLSAVHRGRDLVGGTILGAGLFTVALGIVWLTGGYSVRTVNPIVVVLPAVTGVIFFVGIEETINRGIVLPELESRLGSWIALVVSSLFFASYHVALTVNPTPTAVAVIFVASVIIAGLYLLTRQLWLPIAFHAGWNFAQGAIFGIAVSGNQVENVSLLVGETTGPAWVTGGVYGLEGSLVTLAVLVVATAAVLWQVHRRNDIVPRSWPRR